MTQHGHTVANTTGKEEQMTKQRSKTRSAQDNHHHGLPVVFTIARGGGGMAVLSGTHGRASPSAPDLRFSFVSFRFPVQFSGLCCEFAFKKGCIWLQKGFNSIHTPFTLTF